MNSYAIRGYPEWTIRLLTACIHSILQVEVAVERQCEQTHNQGISQHDSTDGIPIPTVQNSGQCCYRTGE